MAKHAIIERPTKRGILSTLATLFDPQGIITPISISAKVLFQELCINKLGWDDAIPDNKVTVWNARLKNLNRVKSISLPSCFYDESEGEIVVRYTDLAMQARRLVVQ